MRHEHFKRIGCIVTQNEPQLSPKNENAGDFTFKINCLEFIAMYTSTCDYVMHKTKFIQRCISNLGYILHDAKKSNLYISS